MDSTTLQSYRQLVIRLCAKAYAHMLDIADSYDLEISQQDHQRVLLVLVGISRVTAEPEVVRLPDSAAVQSILDLVQEIEDSAAVDLDPIQLDLLDADSIGFDLTLHITIARLREMREKGLGVEESPAEAVASMLRDSGLHGCHVVGAAKRPLADRGHDRRQRRKWIRSEEGRAYLRTKARRRRHPHRINLLRSKIAHRTARLYADER